MKHSADTTPARFATDTGVNVGGWAYESDEQMRFAFSCATMGFGMPGFDDLLDSLPHGPKRESLLRLRGQAFRAWSSGSRELLKSRLESCWTAWQSEIAIDAMAPMVSKEAKRQQQHQRNSRAGADANRRPEHDHWRREAARIQQDRKRRKPFNKSELAAEVKKALNLPEAIPTIAKRL